MLAPRYWLLNYFRSLTARTYSEAKTRFFLFCFVLFFSTARVWQSCINHNDTCFLHHYCSTHLMIQNSVYCCNSSPELCFYCDCFSWLPLLFHTDVIRSIRDPEKPNTLEELDVVTEQCVEVQELGDEEYLIIIRFSPTVPHCSLATLIGETCTHTHTFNFQSLDWCFRTGFSTTSWVILIFVVIPYCFALSAGLCLQVKLQRCLPFKHKVWYYTSLLIIGAKFYCPCITSWE